LNCSKNIAKKVIEKNLLAKNGMLIIESDQSEKVFDEEFNEFIKYKEKLYGRTRISIFTLEDQQQWKFYMQEVLTQ